MGKLDILPCLDSVELAASHHLELDLPRRFAADLGRSAVQAAQAGFYVAETGQHVDWQDAVRATRNAKLSIAPDTALPNPTQSPFPETRVQVTNETTLGASARPVAGGSRPLALNFANGVNPGGGFLRGARAQEEALCRSSALYPTLLGDPMYEAHWARSRADSSDWAIYSPDVPVFRNDDGVALERPWLLSFITCAAPYAPEIGVAESGDLLQHRILRVFEIARAFGHVALVLGAWGCGAFGNDPHRTATDFRHALENEFTGAFSDTVFAITDWSPERRFLGPFRDVFAPDDARPE